MVGIQILILRLLGSPVRPDFFHWQLTFYTWSPGWPLRYLIYFHIHRMSGMNAKYCMYVFCIRPKDLEHCSFGNMLIQYSFVISEKNSRPSFLLNLLRVTLYHIFNF